MTTITYCKGLPTNVDELTPIGYSKFELFLGALSDIFHVATVETVNLLLNLENKFNQSSWNTHLQKVYGISKRHAHGIIANAKGRVDSAKECRITHIKQLKSKLKSAINWVEKSSRKLKLARKFYTKNNWAYSQTNCNFPLSSSLQDRKTNWYHLRLNLHHKKRYIFKLQNRIEHLLATSIRVKVPRGDVFVVGSKDELYGNQICQWNGNIIKFRVPYCLESRFGKYVTSDIGDFNRNIIDREYRKNLAYDYIALSLVCSEFLRHLPADDSTQPSRIAQFENTYPMGLGHFTALGKTVNLAEETLDIARAYLEIPALENLDIAESLTRQSLQTFQEFNRRRLQADALKLLGEIYKNRIPHQPDAAAIATQFCLDSRQIYQELDLTEKANQVRPAVRQGLKQEPQSRSPLKED